MTLTAPTEADAKRLADDILHRVHEPHGAYVVHGWGSIGSAVLLAVAGIAVCFGGYQISNALALAIGVCLLIISALCWIDVTPRLLNPMLRIASDGLHTAEYGFIPWDQVTGVRLDSRPMLFCQFHAMEISVPHRHELMSKAHVCARLLYDIGLYRRRNELRFALTQQGGDARVIAIVAEYLWRESTGWGERSLPAELPPPAWLSASAPQPPHHQPRAS